ncbi:hypothetical protein [Burkholderia cepacia]|uniref:hypothetical protein n=1 Tax=Burkholderia cepacia TaxID=292 RepID=UPI000F5FB1EE|nr:hypothetical protein [Burkholderia cepacia]RRA01127.1 hypothetical protein DF055_21880 [Burkholderia cepacia]RRA04461.1 hypothetical protein DF054_23800 [Burkholderia cepacia]
MPSFTLTTRVVLHKDDKRTKEHSPDASEYETLHAEMHERGYRRYFTNKAKEKVKLPPGEYIIDLKADDESAARDKAMKKAKAAATIATSAERFSVLITGAGNVRGYRLEVIDADPDEETLIEP